MFAKRTLFVVGAGASAEFGLPSGQELAARIANKVDIRFEMGSRPIGTGDLQMFTQLTNQRRQYVDKFQQAGWLIRDGIQLSRSIDDFLDLHKNNEFVVQYGKAAIVHCILEAERGSSLYYQPHNPDHKFKPSEFANTWLVKLLRMLSPGYPVEDVEELFEKIAFVIFNYDRCVEFFLLNALPKLYGIRGDQAERVLARLPIYHPYGVIDADVGHVPSSGVARRSKPRASAPSIAP